MQQTMSAMAGRTGTDRWIMTGGFGLGVLAGLLDEFPSMKVAPARTMATRRGALTAREEA
jgi:hypothetical protein